MKVFEGFTNIFKSDDYDDEDFVNEDDYIADFDEDDYETRHERKAKKVKEKKSSIFGSFKKTAKEDETNIEDSYYEYDDFDDAALYGANETKATEATRSSKSDFDTKVKSDVGVSQTVGFYETGTQERTARVEQPRDRKVVPLNKTYNSSSKGFEVVVIHPQSMEDCHEITDTLLSGKAVILSLEGINPDLAQRIIDYTAGSCYAMRGNLQKVSNYIFLVAPSGVDISGDFFETINSHTDSASYGNDFSMN